MRALSLARNMRPVTVFLTDMVCCALGNQFDIYAEYHATLRDQEVFGSELDRLAF